MKKKPSIIAWWSGGLTSAVACRLALEKYENVRIVYIETGSHHIDTIRFKKDCEKWYGCKIETIQTDKFDNHFDVIIKKNLSMVLLVLDVHLSSKKMLDLILKNIIILVIKFGVMNFL